MKNNILKRLSSCVAIAGIVLSSTSQVQAGADDDPLLSKFMFDQLETRNADQDNPFVLSGQFWLGYDLEKLWIKTDFESVGGKTEQAEVQALYSKAIAPYWDIQAGLRKDFAVDLSPSRNWAVIGLQGLAPYYFEVDTALFIGESGDTAFRFEAEYELLFTQKLILTPEIELNVYGQDDVLARTGSGLSDIELGLRLRYEIRRELAPYIGLNWSRKFGKSADFSRLDGLDISETQVVLGLRAWF